jgi:NADPH:quinone reductase-like Zn-dependent oxidoreductase
MTSSMRSWQWARFGDRSELAEVQVEVPTAGPQQALVQLRASSLNRRDLMVAAGNAVGKGLRPGLVPLSDGAGDVIAIGSGVSRVKVGDRVAATFRQVWVDGPSHSADAVKDLGGSADGTLRDYAVFDERGLVRFPDHLSYVEAATLPCAGVTAWNAVMAKGALLPGMCVLTQGSGGVSVFALQFAKLAGAKVIATTSNTAKAERLRSLGADETVNYREHAQWHPEVLRLSDGLGADAVVEIGGPGTLAQSIAACREGGRVVLVGLLTGFNAPTDGAFMTAFVRNVTISSVHVGHRRSFEEMNRAIIAARLHPVIDSTFPFSRAPEAFERLKTSGHVGKIVIDHGAH